MSDDTPPPPAATCAPPEGTEPETWHFLRADDRFKGEVWVVTSWNGGRWLISNEQPTPEQVFSWGWRYIGPCPPPSEIAALRRQLAEAEAERDRMRDALDDALSGWRYIRKHYGDLSGVGWDRVENAARAALAKAAP